MRRHVNRHPIWSCSVRGFACHPCCHGRGALLPHLFTLTSVARGGIFSVPLVRQVTLPGRYPAHCPSEFGLSSPPATSRLPAVYRSSGHLADCDELIITYRSRFCLLCSRFVFRFGSVFEGSGGSGGSGPGSDSIDVAASAVALLLDAVLLELLVEIAPGRIDHVGGL